VQWNLTPEIALPLTDAANTELRAALTAAPVVPVLVIDRVEDAVPLGRALVAGGLRVLEVTLRTPVALAVIERLAAEVEGAVVAAGTVLNARDLAAAAKAGATLAVSPGLADFVRDAEIPMLPGVATASDLMRGLEWGLDTFKFFPAVPAGGLAMLKALHGPFPDVRFCPTGGVSLANAPEFLSLPNVVCVGGSWVAPAASVAAGDWDRIRQLAAEAAALKTAS
jgi:2-dehydro-3-deoxyphosphogluconate aldolase/(4S)-4-hydroxy-2-oxoglutarate aldolase